MQASPQIDILEEYVLAGQAMETTTSPMAQEFPARPSAEPDGVQNCDVSATASKLHKSPSIPLRKQRWPGLGGMFGHGDKSLPAVNESHIVAQNQSNTSLKRTQSPSSDSRSLPEVSSPIAAAPPPKDPKKVKKEAARMAREAEMERRAQRKKAQQEQSRAVMQNRNLIIMESQTKDDPSWKWQPLQPNSQDTLHLSGSEHSKSRSGGPVRDRLVHGNAALPYERVAKARKREFDDDHSMSSSDVRSSAVVSVMSFATHDSDPGPAMRTQTSLFSSMREPSASSPLGYFDDFSLSGTSDQSHSQHFTQASVDSSSLSDLGSPPAIHTLSLSPARSWGTLHQGDSADEGLQQPRPSRLAVPSFANESPYGGHVNGLSPSPGLIAPKSAINPIFKVVSPFVLK
jgi:meiosis induction protein kinase IME2/SME1